MQTKNNGSTNYIIWIRDVYKGHSVPLNMYSSPLHIRIYGHEPVFQALSKNEPTRHLNLPLPSFKARIQCETTHEIANVSLSCFMYFGIVYMAVDLYNYDTVVYYMISITSY